MSYDFDPNDFGHYPGNNIELLTLTGVSPEVWWMRNTFVRRFERGECICGCGTGEGDETTIINEGCVSDFKKRLNILSLDKADEWRTWLDQFRWQEGETGDTHVCLRALFDDMWRAENSRDIKASHSETTSRLTRIKIKADTGIRELEQDAERLGKLVHALTSAD